MESIWFWLIHIYKLARIYTIQSIEYTISSMFCILFRLYHYNDVKMNAITSQITSLTIVCSTVYSGTDQRKHQSSASLAIVRGIYLWPVNSPHKGPVTWKMFPFDEVIMISVRITHIYQHHFAGTEAIIQVCQCQCCNPAEIRLV